MTKQDEMSLHPSASRQQDSKTGQEEERIEGRGTSSRLRRMRLSVAFGPHVHAGDAMVRAIRLTHLNPPSTPALPLLFLSCLSVYMCMWVSGLLMESLCCNIATTAAAVDSSGCGHAPRCDEREREEEIL